MWLITHFSSIAPIQIAVDTPKENCQPMILQISHQRPEITAHEKPK
nr:MAG TPA: hypothetical protein [Caudoviricetes sp.]